MLERTTQNAPIVPEAVPSHGLTGGAIVRTLPADTLKAVLDVTATALEPERFSASATALVTNLATRLACDRVSLGIVRRGRLQVRALSHNARFNQKTDLLQAIESAMEEALDQQATIVLPHPVDGVTRITQAHEELARRYRAGAICSIPLWSHGQIIGVMTFERGTDEPFDAEIVDLCEAVSGLAGPVIDLKRRDDQWLITKALDAGRDQLVRMFGPGHIALKLALIASAGVLAFLIIATGDFRVSAKAVLEGEVQRAAVAPFDGYLETAPVRAGDHVQDGQVLATLQNHDLRLERLKWLSQHAELTKEYRHSMAGRDAAKVQILTAQIGQAEAQLKLATEKLSRTNVAAPFSGVVVTGDLSQKLGSPVKQGDVLFEIAPLDTYRIVLQVDERDISSMAVGQKGFLRLASVPDEVFAFKVVSVTPVATAKEGRNYFRVESRFTEPPTHLRPAMEGVGKVEVDQRRLVWIWTHEALDWLRLKLWAWLP
jgi:RND family efflux transporter MFP subunit